MCLRLLGRILPKGTFTSFSSANTRMLSLSLSLSHAHTHTYTYIDTHAHTYTHIHARALSHKTNFSVFEKHSELNKREPMPTFSIIPQATRSRWKLEAAQHVIVSLD